jgi:hypothetical protein
MSTGVVAAVGEAAARFHAQRDRIWRHEFSMLRRPVVGSLFLAPPAYFFFPNCTTPSAMHCHLPLRSVQVSTQT